MARKGRAPALPTGLPMGLPTGGSQAVMGQAVTVALLAAAQDGCNCRACQALRKAGSAMTDEFIEEEEENAGSQDSLRNP